MVNILVDLSQKVVFLLSVTFDIIFYLPIQLSAFVFIFQGISWPLNNCANQTVLDLQFLETCQEVSLKFFWL